jgi:hypothetical protein
MKRLVCLALLLPLAFAFADDSPFLEGTEKIELKEPLLRVTRPAKEWAFLDLAVMKKKALEKAGSAKGPVEDMYDKLKVQLEYSSAGADFFVWAVTDQRADLTPDKLGGEILEQTRGFFKDKGKVTGNAKAKLGKLDAWGIEVEGALASTGTEMDVCKLVVYRPDDKVVFVLSLEVPKDKAAQVKKDKKKLFSTDCVKIQ